MSAVRRSVIVDRRAVLAVGGLLCTLAGCELEEVAIPSGEEVYVVHAVMRSDQSQQFVLVERSWAGDFDPNEKENFGLPPNSPQLPLVGATVAVSNIDLPGDPCGPTVLFSETDDGLYRSPLGCPTMRAGDRLELTIDVPGGEVIRGATRVVGLDSAFVAAPGGALRFGTADSLFFNRDADTLAVSVFGGPGRLVSVEVNRINYFGDLSKSAFDRSTILADTTDVSVPGTILDLLERGEGDAVFRAGRNYLMSAGMTDENFFDFVRSQNNVLTGRGFINHLEGAIGVFGSVMASHLHVTVSGEANQPREGDYRMTGAVNGVPVDIQVSIYTRSDADSSALSALITGTWARQGAGAEGAEIWVAWDIDNMSADGSYVGSELEIVVTDQGRATMFGVERGDPVFLQGTWAEAGFQVRVLAESLFGGMFEFGVLDVVRQ